MRVTQSMLSNNMLNNLSDSYSRLAKMQNQISSQKKFTKPSDDPVAAMMGMSYRTDLKRIEQYSSNIGEVKNWLDSTDSALNNAVDVLQRIRELTVQASSGTNAEDERSAISEEIKQLKEQLANIGDTQVGDKYIFNGKNTNVKPSTDNIYSTGSIEIEVFSGIKLQVNTDASSVFGDLLAEDGDLDLLTNALDSNDENVGEMLDVIDSHINVFLAAQSTVGAKINRVELMEDRLGSQEIFATEILSNNEDIDMEKAILEYTSQQSVHEAALSIGSRIIQPTLVDFLG